MKQAAQNRETPALKMMLLTLLATLLTVGFSGAAEPAPAPPPAPPPAPSPAPGHAAVRAFHFGPDVAASDRSILVTPQILYTAERGYGFEPGAPDRFSIALPEGNYDVTITFGDPATDAVTTVNAESRRLMLENVKTAGGERVTPVTRVTGVTRAFTVNVRNSRLSSGGGVRLKDRERGVLHWDDKLTLQFTGPRPAVAALEVADAPAAVTVFLAGDSTVTDQVREPYYGWGQLLPRFFKPGVAIANHAESGEALKSFVAEKRLEKIADQLKAGDYLFIQFGHNDQKKGSDFVEPFTSYKEHLKLFIKTARQRGATPVLVTSMNRRRFDAAGRIVNTHGDYPEAVRQTAAEERVALIDLHAMSTTLYEALGPEESKKAFLHFPPNTFPGQDKPLKDDTHFSRYGGYALARCVVEGIRANQPELAKCLADNVGPFDPARPDPIEP